MDVRVLIAYVAQVAIWGTTWGAIKIGVTDVQPWTYAFARSVLVTSVLTSIALIFRLAFPRGRTLVAAAITGAINSGVSWAIIFWAEQFVPSGLVAIFGATHPIWTGVLAHFLVRGDRLSALKVLALGFGSGGIAVLVGASGEIAGGPTLLAGLLLVLMPLGWAGSSVVMARSLGGVQPISAIAVGSATGGLFLIPFALSELGRPMQWTPEAVAALVYLSFIGSSVGLVLNLWLYRRLRPTTVALSQLLIPVEAVIIGAAVLNEQITFAMIAGGMLVLTAIALNARAGRPRVPPQPSFPEQAAATPAD